MRLFLQEERKANGFTQKQLADKIGADQSEISKIERGERRLDVVELIYICRALGISPGKFIARFEARMSQCEKNG